MLPALRSSGVCRALRQGEVAVVGRRLFSSPPLAGEHVEPPPGGFVSPEEDLFFHQEDEASLRKLLGKLRAHLKKADKAGSKAAIAKEKAALQSIVGKYKLTDSEVKALISWRHSTEF